MVRSTILKLRDAESDKHARQLREGLSIYYLWINIYVSDIGNLDTSSCFIRYSDALEQARNFKKEGFSYVYTVLIYPYGNKSIQATNIYNLLDEGDARMGFKYDSDAEMLMDLNKIDKYPS